MCSSMLWHNSFACPVAGPVNKFNVSFTFTKSLHTFDMTVCSSSLLDTVAADRSLQDLNAFVGGEGY